MSETIIDWLRHRKLDTQLALLDLWLDGGDARVILRAFKIGYDAGRRSVEKEEEDRAREAKERKEAKLRRRKPIIYNKPVEAPK